MRKHACHNNLSLTLLCAFTIFSAMGCNPEESGPAGTQPAFEWTSAQSSCKEDSSATDDSTTFEQQQITVTVIGDSLQLLHEDAYYNCAAQLKLEAMVSGQEIIVQEIWLNPDELVDCMCHFDLEVTVSGLPAGTYLVHLIDAGGLEVGSQQVQVTK